MPHFTPAPVLHAVASSCLYIMRRGGGGASVASADKRRQGAANTELALNLTGRVDERRGVRCPLPAPPLLWRAPSNFVCRLRLFVSVTLSKRLPLLPPHLSPPFSSISFIPPSLWQFSPRAPFNSRFQSAVDRHRKRVSLFRLPSLPRCLFYSPFFAGGRGFCYLSLPFTVCVFRSVSLCVIIFTGEAA